MADKVDSKEKTLAAAARLFRRQGYVATGMADILAAGGAPRGSLYYHFPGGKAQIGEAALTAAGVIAAQAIRRAAEASDTAEAFVLRIARRMAEDLVSSDFEEGCPIATTALEASGTSDGLRTTAANAFRAWQDELAQGLQRFDVAEPKQMAIMILSQLEGALLLARTQRSAKPLRRAEDAVKMLLAARAAK